MAANIKYTVNISADPATGQMSISLVRDGKSLGAAVIDTAKSSSIAGTILGAARRAHEMSGKSNPYKTKLDPVDYTNVHCSGCNVGDGQTPQTLNAPPHVLWYAIPRNRPVYSRIFYGTPLAV